MNLRLSAGLGVVVLCAGHALAAGPANVTSVSGETDAQASAFNEINKQSDFETDGQTASSFGQFPITAIADAITSAPTSSSDADLTASMMMDGTSNTFSALGEAFAEATNGSSDGTADASAGSDLTIIFTVAGNVSWTLDYYAMIGGMDQVGSSGITLANFGGPAIFSVFGTLDGAEDVAMGMLGPGTYELTASAGAGAFTGEGVPSESAMGQFDFTFVVTPTPGAVGLLAMGGLAGLRRKRR